MTSIKPYTCDKIFVVFLMIIFHEVSLVTFFLDVRGSELTSATSYQPSYLLMWMLTYTHHVVYFVCKHHLSKRLIFLLPDTLLLVITFFQKWVETRYILKLFTSILTSLIYFKTFEVIWSIYMISKVSKDLLW